MQEKQCKICGETDNLIYVFTETVCMDCSKELKRIARYGHSKMRGVLERYNEIIAHFIYKNDCEPDSNLLETLSVYQLNKLAHWLTKMSRLKL